MTDRFVLACGAGASSSRRSGSSSDSPASGLRSAPSTSRISVSAPRALSSMRSSAAGVSSALGSRAAPEACTTSAPIRWTSPCTTPASSRLRSSSRAARTWAARCSARTAESRRSSRTWSRRAVTRAPPSAGPPTSIMKKNRSSATGYAPGSATWLARVSRQASTAEPSAARTGRSQAPAANPAATATRTVTGVSMSAVPATRSRSGPQAVSASNVTAAAGRRPNLTSGMGRG